MPLPRKHMPIIFPAFIYSVIQIHSGKTSWPHNLLSHCATSLELAFKSYWEVNLWQVYKLSTSSHKLLLSVPPPPQWDHFTPPPHPPIHNCGVSTLYGNLEGRGWRFVSKSKHVGKMYWITPTSPYALKLHFPSQINLILLCSTESKLHYLRILSRLFSCRMISPLSHNNYCLWQVNRVHQQTLIFPGNAAKLAQQRLRSKYFHDSLILHKVVVALGAQMSHRHSHFGLLEGWR